jgi:hypothetical protein
VVRGQPAEDYRATNPDGSFVDKGRLLARFAKPYPKQDFQAVDVNIRVLGDVALIHSGFLDRRPDGTISNGRYNRHLRAPQRALAVRLRPLHPLLTWLNSKRCSS